MTGLNPEVLERMKAVFSKYPQISEVVLYGSRAKGNYHPGSDIDLTLKGDQLNLRILNKISNELDDLLLPYTIDLSIYSQIENQDLLDHIDRIGQVFYHL
ncbi:MAG: nucleotidyltransferase domain-containing protein [Desulfuromusa sp.]